MPGKIVGVGFRTSAHLFELGLRRVRYNEVNTEFSSSCKDRDKRRNLRGRLDSVVTQPEK